MQCSPWPALGSRLRQKNLKATTIIASGRSRSGLAASRGRARGERRGRADHARHAIVRRNWIFCDSDTGWRRTVVICTLTETAKLNDADPRA